MSKTTKKGDYSGKKRTGRQSNPSNEKKPVIVADTSNGYYDKYPCWVFRRFDFRHPKWGISNNLSDIEQILTYLSNLESQRWSEILTDKSGRRSNTRNHHIDISELSKDAQSRATEIRVDEFGELCSIAISGQKRVWGYIVDGTFFVVWLDVNHEIYPYEKRNT